MIRIEPKPEFRVGGAAMQPVNSSTAPTVYGEILPPFDYAALESGQAQRARAATAYISERHRSVTASVIEIGAKLNDVKADLGHGHFGAWLASEFGWSDKTAQNYMLDAKAFGTKIETVSNLPVTTVHELARASEDVRTSVVDKMDEAEKGGAPLPLNAVKDLLWRAKEAEKAAAAEARKSPEQKAKDKVKAARHTREREKAEQAAAKRRLEEAEQAIKEEKAIIAAVGMIRERFGDDAPKLVDALSGAGSKFSELKTRLEHTFGMTFRSGSMKARTRPWFEEPEEDWPRFW